MWKGINLVRSSQKFWNPGLETRLGLLINTLDALGTTASGPQVYKFIVLSAIAGLAHCLKL